MSFKKEKYLLTERKYALLDCEGIDSKTQTQEEQEAMSCKRMLQLARICGL